MGGIKSSPSLGTHTEYNFVYAMSNLLSGLAMRRISWPDDWGYVYLEEAYCLKVGKGGGLDHTRTYTATFVMYKGDKVHSPGWTPSTEDMLAKDWKLVQST